MPHPSCLFLRSKSPLDLARPGVVGLVLAGVELGGVRCGVRCVVRGGVRCGVRGGVRCGVRGGVRVELGGGVIIGSGFNLMALSHHFDCPATP